MKNIFFKVLLIIGALSVALVAKPIAPLVLLTTACLFFKENYPFSNFPMYASFSNFTYYVYVTDGSGNHIAMKKNFKTTAQIAKKIFNTQIRKVAVGGKRIALLTQDEMRSAGDVVLAALVSRAKSPEWKELRLYQLRIGLEKGKITRKAILVAEYQIS